MKQWFGSNDHATSPMHFDTSHEYHQAAFEAVVRMLRYLKNDRHVELIYIDNESETKVVAYRFTSDKSYNLFWPELLRVGGIKLGHGVWNPFADDYQYFTYFGCPCGPKHGCSNYNSCQKLRGKQ